MWGEEKAREYLQTAGFRSIETHRSPTTSRTTGTWSGNRGDRDASTVSVARAPHRPTPSPLKARARLAWSSAWGLAALCLLAGAAATHAPAANDAATSASARSATQ